MFNQAKLNAKHQTRLALGLAILFAALLRLPTLGLKPPWGDEWSTIVFSLGAGFRGVSLDQLLSLETLLAPARWESQASWASVWERLATESNHPPLFFWLMHGWLMLGDGRDTSGLAAIPLLWSRLLAALVGVGLVPLGFGIARSLEMGRWGAIGTALLLALSPYGVYLGQEARHYTLAIAWEMLSLGLLGRFWLGLRWSRGQAGALALVNSLGVATHLFVGLFLVAEGIVLGALWLWRRGRGGAGVIWGWHWMYEALMLTIAGTGFWPLLWRRDLGNRELVAWLGAKQTPLEMLLGPLGRCIAWLTTMVAAGPVDRELRNEPLAQFLAAVLGATLGVVLLISYLTGLDLTLAARYQFVYWPTLMLLGGLAIERLWLGQRRWVVVVVLALMLVGGVSVSGNWAYQKPDQPDRVMAALAQTYEKLPKADRDLPLILAVVHTSHEQVGEAMGLAWEWMRQRSKSPGTWLVPQPQFVLVRRDAQHRESMPSLVQALATSPRPYFVGTINFRGGWKPESLNCDPKPLLKGQVAGYGYRLSRCP
jgi:uncharacterized membrane protein